MLHSKLWLLSNNLHHELYLCLSHHETDSLQLFLIVIHSYSLQGFSSVYIRHLRVILCDDCPDRFELILSTALAFCQKIVLVILYNCIRVADCGNEPELNQTHANLGIVTKGHFFHGWKCHQQGFINPSTFTTMVSSVVFYIKVLLNKMIHCITKQDICVVLKFILLLQIECVLPLFP